MSEKGEKDSGGEGREPGAEAIRQAAMLSERSVEVLPNGRLAELIEEARPLTIKLGIDPTAPDIHLGHAVVLGKLRDFQEAGHSVVLIIGDFTARVGDPSGRSSQRPMLEPAEIDANARTFQEQAFKILDPDRTEVRFNSEWLRMAPEELLGLMANATVAQLLEREDFRNRMEADEPVSALELLYPLLQGYDSVAIGADVELGGTDQTFNLLFGRAIQASYGVSQQAIMTMPILPGLDGQRRMSKSLGNYVGVTDPPEEMFGKLMSIPDSVLPQYRELLLPGLPETDLPPNLAKREMARLLVDRFHGEGSGEQAEEAFDRLFVQREIPDDVPEHRVSGDPLHIPAVLAEAFGISRSEVRRVIEQGGLKVNGEVVTAESLDLPLDEVEGQVFQLGKRRFVRLVAE
jgi:tyrosyl-tRNA synthetase